MNMCRVIVLLALLSLLGCVSQRLSCSFWLDRIYVDQASRSGEVLVVRIAKERIERDLHASVILKQTPNTAKVYVVKGQVVIADYYADHVREVRAEGSDIVIIQDPLPEGEEWNGFVWIRLNNGCSHGCQF